MVWPQVNLKKLFRAPADLSLQLIFAGLLGLTLIWSWIFWFPLSQNSAWLAERGSAICPPFFQSCQNFNPLLFFEFRHWNDLMGLLGVATLIAVFWQRERSARIFLGLGFLLKLVIFLLDYRLMGNYHLIGFYFVVLFLVGGSISSLHLQFSLIYFFASLLKLNSEWITGAALYGEIPGLKGSALGSAASFVVILEMMGAWLLLSRDSVLRWTAWLLFVLFHLVSAFVVGFFYPIVMLTLLVIFPLAWKRQQNFEWREVRRFTPYFALIVLIQCLPLTVEYPSLTGEARSLSLNMFDAKAKCSVVLLEKRDNGIIRELESPFTKVGYRIGCDPYLYWSHLKNLCRQGPNHLALLMKVRGNRDFFYPVEIAEPNMCREDISYSWWKRNSWIKTPKDWPGQVSSVSLSSLLR